MKAYSFFAVLSFAVVFVNAFSTEEHVRRFFRPEHRTLLPEVKSLQLQDESVVLVPQNDESTKCLAHCEPQCERVDVPNFLKNEHKYLSYENFPVLCRDASAIMLPPAGYGKPQKKYVCKQVFDCCRKCNWLFYTCLSTKPNTYGFCMRGAYKRMCDCVERKSHKELPYNPVPVEGPTPP